MKKSWTRGEKWLWLTPILVGIFLVAATFGTQSVYRLLGWPERLTLPDVTSVRSMALSANGDVLAAGSMINGKTGWKRGSGTVYLWNARTGQPLATIAPVYTRDKNGFTNGFDIYALALSPDARQVGFSRVAPNWTLYDIATQKQLWQFPEFINYTKFSRDGRFIALSGEARICIVDAITGAIKTQWKRSRSDSLDLSWSPNGALIVSLGSYKRHDFIELFRAGTGQSVYRIQRPPYSNDETIASVNFSSDSKKIVVASSVGNYSGTFDFYKFAPVRCYETSTGKMLWEVKAPTFGGADSLHAAFCDAVFSPDGRLVAAYQYWEGKVFLLDAANGEIKTILKLGLAERSGFFVPPGLLFAPDGKRLFARGKNAILFWDLN